MREKETGKVKLNSGDIEALYFEYRKMEGLMQVGVGFQLPKNLHAPNFLVQNYVFAKLLIDLFAVVDKAIDVVFDNFKLKEVRKKSKLTILSEAGHVHNHPYLAWYKEWRNDAAHDFKITEYYLLKQASKDVQFQLLEWGLIREPYEVSSYSKEMSENTFHYGAFIKEVPVLVYHITIRNDGCSYGELINLTLKEFNPKLGG